MPAGLPLRSVAEMGAARSAVGLTPSRASDSLQAMWPSDKSDESDLSDASSTVCDKNSYLFCA